MHSVLVIACAKHSTVGTLEPTQAMNPVVRRDLVAYYTAARAFTIVDLRPMRQRGRDTEGLQGSVAASAITSLPYNAWTVTHRRAHA